MRYQPRDRRDFKRLNVRHPDHDWLLFLVVGVLFGIVLLYGYCFFHGGL